MVSVIFYFSCVGLFVTLSLFLPTFVALLAQESEIALRLAFYIISGTFLFGSSVIAMYGRITVMSRRDNILLLGMIWLFLPPITSIPLLDISHLSFTDSLFETISGLTTTGASVIGSISDLPQSLIFWRAQLQWMGGALALLTLYTILAPLGIGGLSLGRGRGATSVGESRMLPLFLRFALIYVALTFMAFLMFIFSGLRAFHSACLAMASISTGGFLPFDGNLAETIGNTGLFVFTIFLSLGATSIFWHLFLSSYSAIKFRTHRESWYVLTTLFILFISFIISLLINTRVIGQDSFQILLESFYNAASLVSTFGVESRYGIYSLLPFPIIIFVILVGGSVFSTTGGLKHSRIGAMIVQTWNELDRLIYPNYVRPLRFGSQKYDLERMQAIWSFYILTILVLCLGTLLIASSTPSLESALTATISVFTTAGPVYESEWNYGWFPYSDFPIFSKWVLMALMILGRLEVLTVIAFFTLAKGIRS